MMTKRFRIAQRAGRLMLVVVVGLTGHVLWGAAPKRGSATSWAFQTEPGHIHYPGTTASRSTRTATRCT